MGRASSGGWEDTSRAVDRVRDRFGDDAVGPATLLGEHLRRPGHNQWGPPADDSP
jgi:hypothetical protein